MEPLKRSMKLHTHGQEIHQGARGHPSCYALRAKVGMARACPVGWNSAIRPEVDVWSTSPSHGKTWNNSGMDLWMFFMAQIFWWFSQRIFRDGVVKTPLGSRLHCANACLEGPSCLVGGWKIRFGDLVIHARGL